ncbi:right-handed parallel beta-helix repeat-containing protein [bacterium]|nr:right-handed parallel beta-helix repeat-containing protein [bacterium]
MKRSLKALTRVRFIAFVSLILCTVCLAGREDMTPTKGDVSGDGDIDGRDALLVSQSIEGVEVLTPDQQDAADVAPFPGTGGRWTGDGVIDEDDVLRLLYKAVGLVPEGEFTGDFSGSGPVVLDFSPRAGTVGTQVTLTGANFLPGLPNDNEVRFGSTIASIDSMTNTQIVVTVPAGAASGVVTVQTPGGEAVTPAEFVVTQSTPGQFVPPAGVDASAHTIVCVYDEVQADASGNFQIEFPDDRVGLIGAAPPGASQSTYLALRPPAGSSARRADDVLINAETTAETLVFMHPFFITRNPQRVETLLNTMENVPEVAQLATVIAERYAVSDLGLDDPQVTTAWNNAVIAMMNALPSGVTHTIGAVRGERSTDDFDTTIRESAGIRADGDIRVRTMGIDLDYLSFRREGDALEVTPSLSVDYSPVDWLVAIYRLDPTDMPTGFSESFRGIKARNIRRTGYQKSTMVAGNLWTAKIDVLGQGMDFVMDSVLDWVGMGGDAVLPLQSDEDAIYMIRAFSGSYKDRWAFSGNDATAISQVDGDRRLANTATGINVTLALVDVWGLVAGEEGTPSKEAIKAGMQSGLAAISTEMGNNALGEFTEEQALDSILNIITEVGKGIAAAYANEGISQAQDKLQGTLKKALGKAVPLLTILEKISSIGRVGERIVGLMGYIVSPLDLEIVQGPTPLEAGLVLVGDPFSPIVESMDPTSGGPGTEVTITGQRFNPSATQNKVKFGNVEAEVVSVNAQGTQLVVRVPSGLSKWSNPYTISVETPAAMSPKGIAGFTYREIPVLMELSVTEGYPASSNPTGKPHADFAGTEVRLIGQNMNVPSEGPNHRVYFGGTEATITYQTTTSIYVNVPHLTSSGAHDVYVRFTTENGEESTQHLTFNVYGDPTISSVAPTEVPAGATISIQGTNLYDPIQVMIDDVGVGGQLGVNGTIYLASMPNIGDEGQQLALQLWTPRGVVERTITRQAGVQVDDLTPLPAGISMTVTTAASGMTPDGEISLAEAVAMANGSQNFWDGGAYDDKNKEETVDYYERRGGEDPDFYYYWEQGGSSETTLEENNGTAHEIKQFYRVDHFHADHGGGTSDRYPNGTEDLDSGVDNDHKVEEGDRCSNKGGVTDFAHFNGANFADTITESTGARTYAFGTTLALGVQDYFSLTDSTLNITGGVTLPEGTDFLGKTLTVTQPIACSGRWVYVGFQDVTATGDAAFELTDGFQVEIRNMAIHATGHAISGSGGGKNTFSNLTIDSPGGDGIAMSNSDENTIQSVDITDAGGRGIYLSNCDQTLIDHGSISGAGGDGIGVEGGRYNKIRYVSTIEDAANGISLKNTEQAQVMGQMTIQNCTGDGIRIDGGGMHQLNDGYVQNIMDNGGDGLVIVDSELNQVRNLRLAGNSGSGVELRGSGSQHNDLAGLNVGMYYSLDSGNWVLSGNNSYGIHVSNGANNNRVGSYMGGTNKVVANGNHGVLVEGAGTSYNSLGIEGGFYGASGAVQGANQGDGIRIQGGASDNEVVMGFIHGNTGNGITITGSGTDNNLIEQSDIGTLILNDGTNPKPNGGLEIVVSGGAQGTQIVDTDVGANPNGGILLDQISSASLDNVDIGDEVVYTRGKRIAATGVGLDLVSCSNVDVASVWAEGFETGVRVAGAGSSNISLDAYAQYNSGTGVLVDGVSGFNAVKLQGFNNLGSGIELRNCEIAPETISASYNGAHGILVENCSPVTLQNPNALDNLEDGVRIDNCADVLVTNPATANNGQHGLHFLNGSSGIDVMNGYLESNQGWNIALDGVSDVHIGSDPGDYLSIDEGLQGGLQVKDSTDVLIGNERDEYQCFFNSHPTTDIEIGGSSNNVQVVGTYFGANSGSTGDSCIHVTGGSNIKIGSDRAEWGNYFVSPGRDAIVVDGPASNVEIIGNTFGAASTSGSNTYYGNHMGIVLQNGVTGVGIYGNWIFSNDSHGILIQGGAHGNIVTRNHINSNGGDGVHITGTGTTGNRVTQNKIFHNGGAAIGLSAGGNNQIPMPVITNVSPDSHALGGVVNPAPPDGSWVEVFADRDDEGYQMLGRTPFLGNNFYLRTKIPAGKQLHAVALHPDGNTSEYGPVDEVQLPREYGVIFASGMDTQRDAYFLDPTDPVPRQITQNTADDYWPAPMPQGLGTLFVSDREGSADLWMDSFQTEGLMRIAGNPAEDTQADWSGATNDIVFVSRRDGNAELYKTNVDPASPDIRLINSTGDFGDWDSYPTGYSAATVLDADGLILTDLHFYVSTSSAGFEWSVLEMGATEPGAVLTSGTVASTSFGWVDVPISPIAVSGQVAVAMTYVQDSTPMLSTGTSGPDNRYYLYNPSTGWEARPDYFWRIEASAAPGDPTRLTNDPAEDLHPRWSPDGSRIAFDSDRGGNRDVWLMNADGTGPTKLTDGTGSNHSPAWSPDGQSIAFVSDRDGNSNIYTIGADGTGLAAFTDDAAEDVGPDWTWDGNAIVFASNRSEGYEIYRRNVSGSSNAKRLTFMIGDAEQPRTVPLDYMYGFNIDPTEVQVAVRRDVPPVARGGGPTTVTIASTQAVPGGQFTLSLLIDGADDMGNLGFELEYDPAVLEIVSVPTSSLGTGSIYAIGPDTFPDDSGSVRFEWIQPTGYIGSAPVLEMPMRVKASAPYANIPLTLKASHLYDSSLLEVSLDVISGVVTIGAQTYEGCFWMFVGD